jgi:oxygen-dependent protoporphyrinogen oxidase
MRVERRRSGESGPRRAHRKARPTLSRVYRWQEAIPQYDVGHKDRVALIKARLTRLPGLAVAGATYRGIGIPDCISSGDEAAEAVLAHLGPRDAQDG